MFIVVAILCLIGLIFYVVQIHNYENSEYFKDTHTGYFEVLSDKGIYGEYVLSRKLEYYEEKGQLFRNCYVPLPNGHTTEIDIVFIDDKGIFVIESKNYAGWIFGRENQQNWTQTLRARYGSEKHSFYNPIRQNQTHINALSRYLNMSPKCMYSIIAFSDDCEFKRLELTTDKHKVIHRSQLGYTIDCYRNQSEVTFTPTQIEYLKQKLSKLKDKRMVEKARHVQYVQNHKSGMICPYCNGELVIRTVKNGPRAGSQFYGCKNYPYCHYTRNI